jgi:aminotransferase
VINLFQPQVGVDELDAVAEVFGSSWLGVGSRTHEFEEAFAAYVGVQPSAVISLNCCTEGLFQAVNALHLGPGDDVIVPSISFIGAAHAVRSSGATVVLCDVDPLTLNPRPEHVLAALTERTRAVLVLHYGGRPGWVLELAEFAREHSLRLIEDAACSIGSFTEAGACGTLGDIGVWSFDAMKVLTTGDGGMVWCKSPEIAQRIRAGVTLGGDSSGYSRRGQSNSWWEVDPYGVGRRATTNDIAAAIGLVQLRRLPSFLARREEVAAAYDAALADLSWLQLPPPRTPGDASVFYWIQASPADRDGLARHLMANDVYTSFRYWPLHQTRLYGAGIRLEGAERAAASTLLLPLHQGLKDEDVERVIAAVRIFTPVSR